MKILLAIFKAMFKSQPLLIIIYFLVLIGVTSAFSTISIKIPLLQSHLWAACLRSSAFS